MPILTLEPPDDDDIGWQVMPDDTVVLAEVISVAERVMPFKNDDGSEVVRLGFEFKIVEGQHKGYRVQQDVNNQFKAGQRNRLYQWTLILFGVDQLQKGFQLDTNDLIGKKAYLTLGVREWTRGSGEVGRTNTIKHLEKESNRASSSRPMARTAVKPNDPFGVDDSEPF